LDGRAHTLGREDRLTGRWIAINPEAELLSVEAARALVVAELFCGLAVIDDDLVGGVGHELLDGPPPAIDLLLATVAAADPFDFLPRWAPTLLSASRTVGEVECPHVSINHVCTPQHTHTRTTYLKAIIMVANNRIATRVNCFMLMRDCSVVGCCWLAWLV
jgi:hypothetical protein